jgi:hypothetical protein
MTSPEHHTLTWPWTYPAIHLQCGSSERGLGGEGCTVEGGRGGGGRREFLLPAGITRWNLVNVFALLDPSRRNWICQA